MDEHRKNAYRDLVFLAMRDISPLACRKWFQGWRILGPYHWLLFFRRVRFAGDLADWLQDVTQFSAMDFEGFDEATFWMEYEYLPSNYPDFGPRRYRTAFEQRLHESQSSGSSDAGET